MFFFSKLSLFKYNYNSIDNFFYFRCSLNGFGNIESSTTSFSTTNLSGRQNGILSSRQIAHEKWMQEKEQRIIKLKEKKRQEEKMRLNEEERIKREKEEKERRDQETFIKWIERKKNEESVKQEILRRELELQKRLKDIEDKAVVAKTIYLRQWARKKEENHKGNFISNFLLNVHLKNILYFFSGTKKTAIKRTTER